MNRFYSAVLALVFAAAPAVAQDLQADYAPMAVSAASGTSLMALRDSLLNDSGDNSVQFRIGYGFPGGTATPQDPVIGRAIRYTAIARFTVPATRTTPFTLTDLRVGYSTSNVSAANSTPPRVQYDADVEPQVAVFRGRNFVLPVLDSTAAPGAIAQTTLPFTTTTVVASDGYPVPQIEINRVSLVPPGQTSVPASYRFAPGESFTVRIQYFNVPFPQATEAGRPTTINGDSTSVGCQLTRACVQVNLLTYNGPGVPDTTTPVDAFNDQWFIRALSDDAFTTAAETGTDTRAVALGQPYPNPARGMVELPFTLRDAGPARLSVYDVTGREVAVVASRTFQSGGQTLDFDTSNLSAGVYSLVLQVGNERSTQRLSVVR